MASPLACILIPIHNRKEITVICLEQLARINLNEQYQIVIIDDGSTDGSKKAALDITHSATILEGDGNLWWTGAMRVGMEYAYQRGSSFIVWLNNDCLIEDGLIENLVSYCQCDDKAIVGAQGYEYDRCEKLAFGGKVSHWRFPLCYKLKAYPKGGIEQCDMLSGNLVCLPRSVVSNCGYPDSINFPHYGGDTAYFQAALRAGYKLFVDSRKKARNIVPSESSSNMSNWFTAKGSPLLVVNLTRATQSSLYWKLFLKLNINEFGWKGYPLFLLKYIPLLIRIYAITILRLVIPYDLRTKISQLKKAVFKHVFSA